MRQRFSGVLLAALLCAGCEPVRDPPPSVAFGGLPVSGGVPDIQRAGFSDCLNMDAISMRCRRHGVTLAGQGPYEAAVDMVGSDGKGGFDQLTLWHDTDQTAVYKVTDTLKKQGWRYCYIGTDQKGDQAFFARKGTPVIVFMDLSYWGKRRLRVMPEWNRRDKRCIPDH
ncbi:MAG: hypothetical protein V4574_00920 [Pseudomonadota bacterium]